MEKKLLKAFCVYLYDTIFFYQIKLNSSKQFSAQWIAPLARFDFLKLGHASAVNRRMSYISVFTIVISWNRRAYEPHEPFRSN